MTVGISGALSFLTIVGRARTPAASQQIWFPVVGAAIGATVGLVYWGAAQWWPLPIAAALAVVADLCITGLLHIDGLADSADGLLPHLDRARRLEVMSAPDTGAFALAVVAMTILVRWAGFVGSHIGGAQVVAATAGLWAWSRGLMALTLRLGTYARPGGGLASAFGGRSSHRGTYAIAVLTAGLGLGGLMLGRGVIAGAIAGAVALAAGVGVLWLARRRLGGYTGDVLGAAGVMLETVGLIAIAARP
jgi:adenosylcobinamide-GDP ribazoletransferase